MEFPSEASDFGRKLALLDAAAAPSAAKHGGRDQDGVSFRDL
jgi:hypothetical protein